MQNEKRELEEVRERLERLEKAVERKPSIADDTGEWVIITEKDCPILSKYGAKPFRIMKRKMRNEKGTVWNNINFYDAKNECEKRGYRLPDIREMLALLEHYTNTKKEVSEHDKEFLGIEELSVDESVYLEWVESGNNAFHRGGYWYGGADAGAFPLALDNAPARTYYIIGFRCAASL